jgi:hypothetical protein
MTSANDGSHACPPNRGLGLDPDHHSPSQHKHGLCHDATNSGAVLYGIGPAGGGGRRGGGCPKYRSACEG